MSITLKQIGEVGCGNEGFELRLEEDYTEGLTGLEGFSWLNIIWWANQFESEEYRSILTADKPYKNGPGKLGIFATRSPLRPNPVAVTPVYVSRIDFDSGIVYTPYIDADEGTPILDIKPYHGCTDRVERWQVPEWCRDWPASVEGSADFAWEEVFNF